MTAARGLIGLGLCFVVMRFFFPRALLIPVLVIAGLSYFTSCSARFRVVLDHAAGEVAVTTGFWTRHVPLIQIKRVEEVLRFGAEIELTDRWSYTFSPFRKRRWPERQVQLRTGFEGMELAITEAAAAARAASPGRTSGEDAKSRRAAARREMPGACLACGAGLFLLGAAALVQPQAGGWAVHSMALLLRIFYGAGGVAVLLIGARSLRRAWRGRCTATGA